MEYKKSTDSEWIPAAGGGRNWKYEPELNKIIVKPTFQDNDHDIRLIYLQRVTVPTTTSSNMPSDDFIPAIQLACEAEYMRRFANYKLRDKDAVTKELTYHPGIELLRQSQVHRELAERDLALVKPRIPTQAIQILQEGRKR